MDKIANTKKIVVSAIVPVFNEEQTVSGVIETLLKNPLIDEVICINDGSTDDSLKKLKNFKNRIQIISLRKNKGKGFALAKGIKNANGKIVLFIDADLVNLSDAHLEKLLNPISNKEIKAVLGYPTKNEYFPEIFSKLTGERVYYRKDLIPHLVKMSQTRFGVEVFLNSLFKEKETKKIPLKHLKGLLKYEKRNSSDAIQEYLNEAVEIALEIGRKEGLLPADKKIINKLTKVSNLNELKKTIEKLYNKSIKQFFEKYILKYMRSDFFK